MSSFRVMTIAIALTGAIALPAIAQQQLPRPGKDAPPPPPRGQQQAPAPQPPGRPGPQAQQPQTPPPAPYATVMVSEPKPFGDASLAAFRTELAAVAKRKDRAALAKMVVPQGFFWMKENGDAAGKKPSIDNLSAALNLPAKDGSGWETLNEYATDDTASPFPERANAVCSPSGPQFDTKELEKLAQSTGTDLGDWGFTSNAGVEMRASAQANAPVVEKLGMQFIRVMPDTAPNASQDFIRIVAPSGKVGFIAADSINPLGSEQLCYAKDASGAWRIAGFVGGD